MSDFWTDRRARVRAEDRQAEAAALAAAQAEAQAALAAEQAAMTEPELLAHLGLPDPDGLAAGDDFTAFLRREVPDVLRRRALRQLWTSNPVLANLDGLVDHGEDYTDAAMVKPAMQTAYRVGQGMVERVLSGAEALLAGDDARDDTGDGAGVGAEAGADAPPAALPNPVRRTMPQPLATPPAPTPFAVAAAIEAPTDAPAAQPAPHHMRFRFDEAPA